MPVYNPIKFLLNQDASQKQAAVTDAPAYSLTKVLASAAVIIGPIATVVVDQVKKGGLSPHDYVVLAVALLAFLAITASADVIGRSLVTAAEKRLEAAEATIGDVTPYDAPVPGHRITAVADVPVQIIATAPEHDLVRENGHTTWRKASEIVRD